MNTTVTILFSTLLLVLPAGTMAASHEGGHGGHSGHEMSQEGQAMQHGGMMMGGMIMLEEKTEDGVRGMVHLNDVGEAMAKMGMKENFHFMVMFTDTASGGTIAEGTVALKVIDPAGKESEPVALVLMDGMFGADLALTEKGPYRFVVGTRLADGKKRQFEFTHTLQ
jgi:hypothetical protein